MPTVTVGTAYADGLVGCADGWRPSAYNISPVVLHGLAGDQGDAKDFEMVVDRDVALVNKNADALKDDYPVPANWWLINHKHKAIKGVVGRWTFDNIKDV
ncbi:hypothetical protein QYE76_015401 [Lolium multiflorum]|uniref:Phospholipase A1 n=1 Tax=Lolium multiflorum TaxID=4521 RepID=A0AAD8X9T8_LOLMU|nr:hypothetical protein QYE76_015401 [Lolium multiflorum]